MEILKNGIRKFKIDNQTVWDMRRANNGRYKANALKENDIVVYSERKVYLIAKDHSYKNLNKADKRKVVYLLMALDKEIAQYGPEKLNTQLKKNAG